MHSKKLSLVALFAALLSASAVNAATVTTGNSGLVLGAMTQGYDAAAAATPGTPVTTNDTKFEIPTY